MPFYVYFYFETLLKLCMWMRVSGDRFFDKDNVDTGTAGALTDTQQLLLPIQSPNQSNLLPSALQSVLPLAFYTTPYQCACCFLVFAGRLQVQPRCFISLILNGEIDTLLFFNNFPKCIFLEFPFCLFQIILYPQTRKNFSCDRCALWMVRNRLTAWFRMPHLWHGELHWIKKSLIDIVSSLWRPQKIRLYYNSSISMLSFFRFYGKILPFRILQLCAKEKTVKCATTAE